MIIFMLSSKCDMYFTIKVKLDALLRTTFRLFLVPEDEIDAIINL